MARAVKVPMWESTDGRRWETRREAERADAEGAVRNLVEHHGFGGMTKDDVVDMILDHHDEFRQALGTFAVAEAS